jgi:tetratricopeptide (TPR) repeat protein
MAPHKQAFVIRKRVAYPAALLRLVYNRLQGMRSLIQSISLPYERYLGALLRGSFILAFIFVFGFPAVAAEKSAEETKPAGPPQPRIIEESRPEALPPRKTDPSWLSYQEGQKLFAQKRLGESLLAFKKAIDERASLFARASSDIDAALATKEAARAKGSLSALVRLLALRDMIPQDYEALHEKAAGSIVTEMGLIRESSPTDPLRGLIDAALLVGEEGGLSRIGDSLAELKKAAADFSKYPEAEFALGKLYLAEGEARLAELQMLKARDMSASLLQPEDRFDMLESLAELYKARGDLNDYEAALREIADSSDLFATKDEYYRNSMERILGNRGFDTFMKLFRVEQGYPIGAYTKLGELYLDAGRPIATLYLAAAANACLTRDISEIRVDEPGYEYSGLVDLASRIVANRDMATYAIQAHLWKNLVLLGESLTTSGDRDTARELWTIVAKMQKSESWGKKAAEDLSRLRR